MGVQEREQRQKREERLFEEIMAKNFPDFLKDINHYFKQNKHKETHTGAHYHQLSKAKDKEITLKAAREK